MLVGVETSEIKKKFRCSLVSDGGRREREGERLAIKIGLFFHERKYFPYALHYHCVGAIVIDGLAVA